LPSSDRRLPEETLFVQYLTCAVFRGIEIRLPWI
jgi:hypothetical protein